MTNKAKRRIRIGTRGSQLALWQANWIKDRIEEWHSDVEAILVKIKTSGDKILDVPLAKVGGKGLFVKEIEEALLDGGIDLAVHSMKDVPMDIPEGLTVQIVPEREDVRDAFISRDGRNLESLPRGAVVGTSSLRRQAQLLNYRPDLVIESLRGNVGTRLRKLKEGKLKAIILASAGLKRLGFADQITEYLSLDLSLPAIGQGALGIETRRGDEKIEALLVHLDHRPSNIAVRAERAFLKRLEGGCQVPIAAYGSIQGEEVHLEGMVSSIDGKRLLRRKGKGSLKDSQKVGENLAEELLSLGAAEILAEIYGSSVQ